jgi:hypothetical protein
MIGFWTDVTGMDGRESVFWENIYFGLLVIA